MYKDGDSMKVLVYDQNKALVDFVINEMHYYKTDDISLRTKGIWDKNELVGHIKTNRYDVAYLDISVDHISLVNVVDEIKKLNSECMIIFMCEEYRYVYDLFDSRIFHYLYKPIEEHQFKVIFLKLMEIYKKSNATFLFNTATGKTAFLADDIFYIETYYDNLKIITKKKSYYSNIKNAKYMKESLQSYDFIQIHQSFYVNMNAIYRIEKNSVILSNGEELPISPYKKKDVVEKFENYAKRKEE